MKNTKEKEKRHITTIRLEESLVKEIDRTAENLGVSRNEVISMYMRMGMIRKGTK